MDARPVNIPRLSGWLALSFLVAGLMAGCGAPSRPTPTPTPVPAPQLQVIAASSDYGVGEDRFTFGLVAPDGRLVEGARAQVRFYRPGPSGQAELVAEADAPFRQIRGNTPHHHEGGEIHLHEEVKGIYVVERMVFDQPGQWLARFQVAEPGAAAIKEASLAFQVQPTSATFRVGDRVPPSRNPTARDVQDLKEITTHEPPVPGLYELTVAEALQQGKPLVVAFATPAFCQSRMCGPVIDVVVAVYQSYQGRVNFIHIEPYDLKTQRNEGRLVLSPVVLEWRLPTEPWVFVVDKEGRVAARFEGLATAEELSAAIEAVLAR